MIQWINENIALLTLSVALLGFCVQTWLAKRRLQRQKIEAEKSTQAIIASLTKSIEDLVRQIQEQGQPGRSSEGDDAASTALLLQKLSQTPLNKSEQNLLKQIANEGDEGMSESGAGGKPAVGCLLDNGFISKAGDLLVAHPAVREYFSRITGK